MDDMQCDITEKLLNNSENWKGRVASHRRGYRKSALLLVEYSSSSENSRETGIRKSFINPHLDLRCIVSPRISDVITLRTDYGCSLLRRERFANALMVCIIVNAKHLYVITPVIVEMTIKVARELQSYRAIIVTINSANWLNHDMYSISRNVSYQYMIYF